VPGDLDDLAGAVGDGERVDWDAAHARLTTPDSRSVAAGLEYISRLSHVASPAVRLSRRLPWLLEAATVFAILRCLAGLAGYAFALEQRRAVIVAILCTFGAVALTLQIGGRDRRARALAACFWTTAAAFAARGALGFSAALPGVFLLRLLAVVRPEAFFAAALWQFGREFPRLAERFSRLDRVCAWGVRAALLIGAGLFVTGLAPLLSNEPLARSAAQVAAAPQPPADSLFWLLVFGAAMVGLVVIAWRGRLAHGPERARARLFLYAVIVAFGPVGTQVVAAVLIPAYLRVLQTPRGFFWSSMAVYPPMFLLPIATAYAVAARDVLDVRVAVQRGLRYVLARWLLAWGAAVPVALLLWHLYRHSNQTLSAALADPPAPTLLWFAGVGVVVLAFRGSLIRALDVWALPGAEAPAAALASITGQMKQARTPLEVTTTLARGIERVMQGQARSFLYVDGRLVPAEGGEPPLPAESAIPALMEGAREPAMVSGASRRSYYTLLLQTDRAWIDAERIEIAVPVLAGRAGGGLLGLVTLSGRRNALGFSDDDLRFLSAVAAAASLACDAIVSEGTRGGAAPAEGLDEVALQCLRCGLVADWTAAGSQCPCGGLWEPAALPKRVLGRFDLVEWLGAGGMGVVYRATDLTLVRDVAVKTLPALSEESARRLLAEAQTMASLSHEDVAVLHDVERWRGTPVLVLEYLSGGTLASRLRHAPLRDAEAVALVRRLAQSLTRLHGRRLYHGDIKPSNIGFTSDGAPKLLDFGLARALATGEAASSEAVQSDTEAQAPRAPLGGTWAYLAPEVRDGAAPGPMLDLWALGVVLCEAWLGEHPFPRARTRQDVEAGLARALARLRAERSSAHALVVARALALDPAERPTSAAAFEALLGALQGTS
jgi:hypothetical protein